MQSDESEGEALTVLKAVSPLPTGANHHFHTQAGSRLVWTNDRTHKDEVIGSETSGGSPECPIYVIGALWSPHVTDRLTFSWRLCFRGSAVLLTETPPHSWHFINSVPTPPEEDAGKNVIAIFGAGIPQRHPPSLGSAQYPAMLLIISYAKLPRILASLSRHSSCLDSWLPGWRCQRVCPLPQVANSSQLPQLIWLENGMETKIVLLESK